MLQLSIFLENSKGRLAEVISLLAELKVNLRALSLADTKDYGVLRIIVDEPERTTEKLRERKVVVSQTQVWLLKVPDRTGGLAGVLNQLVQHDVVVEYMYAFVEKENEQAQVVVRVRDQGIMENALRKLNLPLL
ncbi:amino acid-binding protein [Desulfosporosinus sp. PR]|uniref:ACT domain-containing protein n=1 Tax=Candidatus Desulfosporosinus nitrosoreducens TaxID=3401928 RepID=UPI0027ECCEE8|nr:ACT domain-containing protein [Desulfosporosinus sp. PR]MDQ7094772.1 amino acid-binding protein [Desulfosporosinus sp. PR]